MAAVRIWVCSCTIDFCDEREEELMLRTLLEQSRPRNFALTFAVACAAVGGLGAGAGNSTISKQGTTCAGVAATRVGTNGNDEIYGTSRRDVIVARGGLDEIYGRGGGDLICAGAGNDDVEAGPGADRVYGQEGPDDLEGQAGNDRVSGGSGRDELYGHGGNDRLNGGASVDEGDGGPGRNSCTQVERRTRC
jgi:Ca2+-binding RTX toxin-like protein